ncbi:F510_1955 family glycosylhydrolase [Neobacillus mesonae]|uniref:F510_1955 family glycosylhydrolase n=1 Tax=Neobacillus mesonae TaxID=1193713 RepID=UPI002E23EA69|nr:hypothetical protein [Neobacillus mesonae]
MKRKALFSFLTIILIVAAGCSNKNGQETRTSKGNKGQTSIPYEIVEAKSLKVSRIFGIGYPGNDQGLYIASNSGIKINRAGKWLESNANRHQYMGFQAVESGFLASGKPEKGTEYKGPLGIVKSNDKGKSLEKLAFYEKANFHFIAAGFYGTSLYVINEKPVEPLSLGVNYSPDNGKSWRESTLNGFKADSFGMMAVHPKNGNVLAMATRSGIYYSSDSGDSIKLVTEPLMITAVTFLGDSLLYSSVENEKIMLKTLNPVTGKQTTLNLPFLDYDNPITYLAVNPKNQKQMAFSTYKNDLNETTDGGNKWVSLLLNGKNERD